MAARWIGPSTEDDTRPLTVPVDGLAGVDVLVPVLGLARTTEATWLLSELDTGVPLRRLLARARLTPLQAAAVVVEVHRALVALHEAGHWHGRVHPGNVHVDATGRVRLGDWGLALLVPPSPPDGHRDADLRGLAELAAELADQARLPRPRAGSPQAELLATLDTVAELGPVLPAPAPLAVLGAMLGEADALDRAQVELAAMVAVLRRSGRPRDPAATAVIPAQRRPSDAPEAAAARATGPRTTKIPPPVRRARPVWRRRLLVFVATITLLGSAVTAEVLLLDDAIRDNWRELTQGPPGQDGRDPRQLVTQDPGVAPAPPAAGPISGVDVRALDRCAPGTICAVRVLVRVWPDEHRRQVHWGYQIIDRCTGTRTSRPGGVVEVPGGADQVDALGHVRMPRSGWVVVVTSVPTRAASAPLQVPGRTEPCR